jgi:2-oxoglutarate dehydrogenase E2 component (dihydrolipoamide succinyltransferase)
VELPAPVAGTLAQILKQKGETAQVGETIAYLESSSQPAGNILPKTAKSTAPAETVSKPGSEVAETRVMPAAQRVLAERGLRSDQVQPTGPGGRLLKEDVLRQAETSQAESATTLITRADIASAAAPEKAESGGFREEEVVPMSRLRRTVAERLVEAQRNAALLTTFNEIDVSNVSALRKQYGESFQQKTQREAWLHVVFR